MTTHRPVVGARRDDGGGRRRREAPHAVVVIAHDANEARGRVPLGVAHAPHAEDVVRAADDEKRRLDPGEGEDVEGR